MKEAINLRFDQGSGHQKLTVFMDGANCGNLTMKPEEALWFYHICQKGCEYLRLTFNASGKPITPPHELIDKFATDHSK